MARWIFFFSPESVIIVAISTLEKDCSYFVLANLSILVSEYSRWTSRRRKGSSCVRDGQEPDGDPPWKPLDRVHGSTGTWPRVLAGCSPGDWSAFLLSLCPCRRVGWLVGRLASPWSPRLAPVVGRSSPSIERSVVLSPNTKVGTGTPSPHFIPMGV